MTETHDVKTFDLTDWLVGGTEHRLTETVTIYRDPTLVEEIEAYRARQANIPEGEEAAGYDSLGEADPAEDAALLARIEASKAEVTVFALIDSEMKEARTALGEKPEGYKYFEDMGFWYEVFSRAARLQGQKLTAEQWAKVHETIGAQFALITQAYGRANTPDLSPRFRGLGTSRTA